MSVLVPAGIGTLFFRVQTLHGQFLARATANGGDEAAVWRHERRSIAEVERIMEQMRDAEGGRDEG